VPQLWQRRAGFIPLLSGVRNTSPARAARSGRQPSTSRRRRRGDLGGACSRASDRGKTPLPPVRQVRRAFIRCLSSLRGTSPTRSNPRRERDTRRRKRRVDLADRRSHPLRQRDTLRRKRRVDIIDRRSRASGARKTALPSLRQIRSDFIRSLSGLRDSSPARSAPSQLDAGTPHAFGDASARVRRRQSRGEERVNEQLSTVR
jgi:hypothetical protein